MQEYNYAQIARVVHEAQRALQYVQNDLCPAPPWDAAPDEMREDCIRSVRFIIEHDCYDAAMIHDVWMTAKEDAGWVYGEVKDASADPPTHPCIQPWHRLPAPQRDKDVVFLALTRTLAGLP